jgi:hypothetical protein
VTPDTIPTISTLLVTSTAVVVYRFLVSPITLVVCRLAMPPVSVTPGPEGTGSAAAERTGVSGRAKLAALGGIALAVLMSVAVTLAGHIPDPGGMRFLVCFLLIILSWAFGSTDFDLRRGARAQVAERVLLVVAGAVSLVWPLALFAWLAILSGRLRGWTHHAMMPIRLLKAYVAWYLGTAMLDAAWHSGAAIGERPGLFLLLAIVCLSHYIKPAWSKATLGPRWWSWAMENRTDFILANAYNVGWVRFLPEKVVLRILIMVRPYVRLLNIGTMTVELSPLVAFTDRRVFVAVAAATVVFHTAIFLGSGILFWESIGTNAALAATVILLPDADIAPAFGLWVTMYAIIILMMAVREFVWQPYHLGWWDSPFTTRILWRAETSSGQTFNLRNDFMCPFEREFGRWTGLFFVPEPVIGGASWGATLWDRDLRDQVRTAAGDLDKLDELKRDHGALLWNEKHCADHVAFLVEMFSRLNAGAVKGPLPMRLRWLKPPGGQISTWGDDLPRYRRTEPVCRIVIMCEERCYVERLNTLVILRTRTLQEIDIPETQPPTSVAE